MGNNKLLLLAHQILEIRKLKGLPDQQTALQKAIKERNKLLREVSPEEIRQTGYLTIQEKPDVLRLQQEILNQ